MDYKKCEKTSPNFQINLFVAVDATLKIEQSERECVILSWRKAIVSSVRQIHVSPPK